MKDRHAPAVENGQEILGRGLDQPDLSQRNECGRLHSPGAANTAGFFAVGLHLVHYRAPRPFCELRILRGQTGLEQEMIEPGVGDCLAFDF
jgi:hypothetical protein